MFLLLALFFSIIIFCYYIYVLYKKIKSKEELLPIITSISSHLAYFSAIIFFIYQNSKDNNYIDIEQYNLLFWFSIIVLICYSIYTVLLYSLIKFITINTNKIINAIKNNKTIVKHKIIFIIFIILFLLFLIIFFILKHK